MEFEVVESPSRLRRSRALAVAKALELSTCFPRDGSAPTFSFTTDKITYYGSPTTFVVVDVTGNPSPIAFRVPPCALAAAVAKLAPFTAHGHRLYDGKRTSVAHYKGARYTYTFGPVLAGHKVIAHCFRLLSVEPLLLLHA